MEQKIFTAEVSVRNATEVVQLTTYGKDGGKRSKTISYQDFVTSLAKGVKKEGFSLGMLPEGTLWFNTGTDSTTDIIVRIPGRKRTFLYQPHRTRTGDGNARIYEVPYPDLVMRLTVSPDRVQPTHCLAVLEGDPDKVDENTPLYRFPFGNVAVTGHICMGGNLIPRAGMGLKAAVREGLNVFFGSPFNGDYYTPCAMIKTGDSLGDALKKLEKMDTFPGDWLVPAGMTLSGLF